MKTIKERAQSLLDQWREASDWNESVSEFLREMIDAPEPKPVAYQVRNGWVDVAIYQRQIDADNYAKDQQKRHDLSGSLAHFCVVPLYTAPPAPSVPDGLETTRFLTDVTTAAGLLGHGRQDKGLAQRIGDFAHKYRMLAVAPQPPKLSDERIYEIAMSDNVSLIEYQGPGVRPRIIVHNSIGGVYAFARAIEQELMKGCV